MTFIKLYFQLVTCSWRLNYNYLCQPVKYSTHPDEMRVSSQHENTDDPKTTKYPAARNPSIHKIIVLVAHISQNNLNRLQSTICQFELKTD